MLLNSFNIKSSVDSHISLLVINCRLRKDVGLELLSNFNPLSIDPDDIRQFQDAIVHFQKQLGITNCQSGVLCAKTIFHMKQFLKNRRAMSVQSDRGKTM